jgi:DNA-binding NtrC family response regulator
MTDACDRQGLTTLDPEPGGIVEKGMDEQQLCLVVAWWKDDAARVGEVLIPSTRDAIFGRSSVLGGEARLSLVRQRPGGNRASRPLDDRQLSRDQLRIRALSPERALLLERLGRRALLLNGRECERAEPRAGDLVEIQGLCVFLCVQRPRELPSSKVEHPFGEPDANGIIGESPAAWALRQRIYFASSRSAHVLITGPSGAGKELVARAIHRGSDRCRRPLVSRNAATLPPSLAVAELFGNAANYPNGGMSERPGLIGQAEGSTLFLDEIGELPTDIQAHLLRVLDGGEYHRLGDARPRTANLRFIAATNRAASDLKPDLAARFALRIDVPGLDQRVDDIALIARHLLRGMLGADAQLAHRFATGGASNGEPRWAPTLVQRLLSHSYATHVRELERLLWLSLETSRGDTLTCTEEVSAALERSSRERASSPESGSPESRSSGSSRRGSRQPLEMGPFDATRPSSHRPHPVSREELRAALDRHDGMKEAVWRELGLSSRHVLTRLMRKFGEA